jgi:uncharacterized protein (DUF2384 family)
MEAKRTSAITTEAEQRYQLEHPSAKIIRARAVEAFGDEELARDWMRTPLAVLNQHTPEQYARSHDRAKQREVLAVLGRIDYGILG